MLRSPGLLSAAGAIFLIMAGFAGFMFAFALHQQIGLRHTALRAGLLSAPLSICFGLSSLHWQRLPKRVHLPLPVLALALVAPAYIVVGELLRAGGEIGLIPELVLSGLGLAAGCAYAPLFARALNRVEPADAADASGVLVTVVQLGQVVGVALLGTVFLGQVSFPAPTVASGHALLVTVTFIGGALLLAVGFALRTHRAER